MVSQIVLIVRRGVYKLGIWANQTTTKIYSLVTTIGNRSNKQKEDIRVTYLVLMPVEGGGFERLLVLVLLLPLFANIAAKIPSVVLSGNIIVDTLISVEKFLIF